LLREEVQFEPDGAIKGLVSYDFNVLFYLPSKYRAIRIMAICRDQDPYLEEK